MVYLGIGFTEEYSRGTPLEVHSIGDLDALNDGVKLVAYRFMVKEKDIKHQLGALYASKKRLLKKALDIQEAKFIPTEEAELAKYADLLERQLRGGRHEA